MANTLAQAKSGPFLNRGLVLSGLIFLIGLGLSVAATYSQYQSVEKRAHEEFDRMSVRTEAQINSRMENAVRGLLGVRGLFAVNPKVDRTMFRDFVLSRDMAREFPGVRGFGFIQRVTRDNVASFVATAKADGAPAFSIRQLVEKDHHDLYVVKYLEPAANNKGAQGLDLGSEAKRGSGIRQAINTGAATVTGAITLVQDNKKQSGLLLYLPVFRKNAPTNTVEQRNAALVGVLYAPIVVAEILDGIPDVQTGLLDFEIFDSPINSSHGVVMFDADDHLSHLAQGQAHDAGRRYSLRKPLELPGRSVTLEMNSTPMFDASVNAAFPWMVFAGGALISLLLAAMLHQQSHARQRAEDLAYGMTQDLQAALRDSEALLSTLKLHTIVSIADRGGRIIEVNDAFCAISGYARAELLGQDHRIVNSDVQAPSFWVDMWKTISSGMPWRGHVCNRGKDGTLYWVDTLIAPFIGSDGKIEKYISIRTDISQNKQAEHDLKQATQEAQAASLSKSQFLANMSHEIRTPMNAILGMLTLLRKTDLTTRQADYAAKSDGAARALLGLLNEILDFSKIEAGKMTLDPHPFSLDQLLRDLSVILSTTVGDKPIEVLFDVDPTLPPQLVGDAMRLQQVLLNLASNAIKFTTQGEVVLSIQVQQRSDDVVTLQFNMRDSGIGIAPEHQARIFSGFTQAESSTTRRFGGTGLGVVISQRFVSMMGGDLELQSEVGQGSRFYFTVSLPIAPEGSALERQHMPERIPERMEIASWRTLVIDDNPLTREVLEHMGQSMGWQVDLAESGEQALEMLQQRSTQGMHYQAIFVDWNMPGMDGWQTSQRIRTLQAQGLNTGSSGKAPVVVMVTAHGREMLSQRSQADQALLDGFLVKPVTASMLLDAVMDARAGHDHPHTLRVAAQTSQRRLAGMRLLVVEDNLNNQQVARELLQDEGALVQIANHGQEAVEAIAAAAAAAPTDTAVFDVVLMDLQMPVMDGFAATRIIRHDLGQTTLPIVAMTANAMASDREACLAVGMNDHVGKPFDLNDLVRVLRRQAQWGDALEGSDKSAQPLPPSVEQAATAGGVDIHAALQRLGGKLEVYRRMLALFVKDLQDMPERLHGFAQIALPDAAPDDTKRLLHTLKGLAATLGATELSIGAASAEKLLAGTPGPELLMRATEQACHCIDHARAGLAALLEALDQNNAHTNSSGADGKGGDQVDQVALVQTLRTMVQLLQVQDMDAMNTMAQFQQQFGEALGEDTEALGAAMADLDFDKAQPLCLALIEKYGP